MQFATEEQTDKAIDLLGSILSAKQVPFLESWMAFFRFGFAISVLILSSRIIATPPPFVQGFALVLPAPAWSTMLLFTTCLTAVGRKTHDLCTQRNGSAGGFFVMVAMLGPLLLKAPGLACMVFLLSVPHLIVALHLHRRCRKANQAGGSS